MNGIALVTGASSGFGLRSAVSLARCVLPGRMFDAMMRRMLASKRP